MKLIVIGHSALSLHQRLEVARNNGQVVFVPILDKEKSGALSYGCFLHAWVLNPASFLSSLSSSFMSPSSHLVNCQSSNIINNGEFLVRALFLVMIDRATLTFTAGPLGPVYHRLGDDSNLPGLISRAREQPSTD